MRIVFMGTPDFAVPCLEKILADGHEVPAVFTQPDKPVGRHATLTTAADLNLLAQRHQAWAVKNGISLFTGAKPKTPNAPCKTPA